MKLPQQRSGRSHKKSILAVDDDPEVRKVTRAALESAGFEVWGAKSGEEALQMLDDRGLPHLAVIDIMLPGLDGLSIIERWRQNGIDVPVLIAVGQDDEGSCGPGLPCKLAADIIARESGFWSPAACIEARRASGAGLDRAVAVALRESRPADR